MTVDEFRKSFFKWDGFCWGMMPRNYMSVPGSVFIYGFFDRATGECRYIGKTTRPVDRLSWYYQHVCRGGDTYILRWLRKRMEENRLPILEILEVASSSTWRAQEKWWIDTLINEGHRLTNLNEGGGSIHVLSGESRKKLSESIKGKPWKKDRRGSGEKRYVSPETRERLSAALKGKPRPKV